MVQRTLLFALVFLCTPLIADSQVTAPQLTPIPPTLELVKILNRGDRPGTFPSRAIYFYLPEADFDLPSAIAIFEKYKNEYCEPDRLTITIFSDKSQLAKQISFDLGGFYRDFRDDEAGQKAAKEYYDRVLPSPTGYLQARYWRSGDLEYYDHGLKKDDPRQTRVLLRQRKTGELPSQPN